MRIDRQMIRFRRPDILVIAIMMVALCAVAGCAQKDNPERPLKPPRGYLNETFMKMAYGLGMIDIIDREEDIVVPDSIAAYKNLEYKNIDSVSLQLDMYKLKELTAPAPALIFVHGGSWRGGDRGDYLPYLVDFASRGYVAISVSYRLVKVARYPAAVQDLQCAVRWVKAHARQYGIDPDRIALIGGSAGGHLSMMVGYGGGEPVFNEDCGVDTTNSSVKLVVNLYGPVDLTTPYAIGRNEVQDFLGTTYDKDPGLFLSSSPKTYITPDDPPTLTFHGTIDSLVPVSQVDSLDVWLTKAGIPHEYHRLKGWPHAMDLSKKVNDYTKFYIDRFLERYL
jgi:acetyl esterase/lipase